MKDLAAIGTLISKSTFAALGFMFPLLVMVCICLLKAAGLDGPFQLILWLYHSKMLGGLLIVLVFICSVILTYDIFKILHIPTPEHESPQKALQKAYLDLSLIVITICLSIFIFLFHAFDMLGNIPVGRD